MKKQAQQPKGGEHAGLRQAILAAASNQFVSAGYHGASMRAIARESGASKALLYYHFENKADLYFGLLIENIQDLGALVNEARTAGGSVREQMQILLRGILGWSAEKRTMIYQARQEIKHLDMELRRQFMERFHRQFIGQIESILEAGMQQGEIRTMDPALAAQLFFGMAMAPMIPEDMKQGDRSTHIIESILQIYFEGVAA